MGVFLFRTLTPYCRGADALLRCRTSSQVRWQRRRLGLPSGLATKTFLRTLCFPKSSSNTTKPRSNSFSASRRLRIAAWNSVCFSRSHPSFKPSNAHPAAANDADDNANKPNVSVKPFIKQEKNLRFFIVPVLSLALFPQFRGARQPGVLRTKGQKGTFYFTLD